MVPAPMVIKAVRGELPWQTGQRIMPWDKKERPGQFFFSIPGGA
jgi:hypothetical protein